VAWSGRGWRGCGCEQEHAAAVAWRLGEEVALRSRRVRAAADQLKQKESEQDPNERLKEVRSALYAMTGRGGRMTGHDGGSVRSQSSRLLERPDASDYARSDADRVRSHFAQKTETDNRTRWWWPGPDAVVSNCASGAASD
jgi:hypothetical protein